MNSFVTDIFGKLKSEENKYNTKKKPFVVNLKKNKLNTTNC